MNVELMLWCRRGRVWRSSCWGVHGASRSSRVSTPSGGLKNAPGACGAAGTGGTA